MYELSLKRGGIKPYCNLLHPMKKILLALPMLFLIGASCSQQASTQQFNPGLVVAKQKCQEAVDKWGTKSTPVIRSHFNPGLNACLVEYTFSNSNLIGFSIVDIFDDNKELLRANFTDPSKSAGSWSNLFENGIEVNVTNNNVHEEYFKKAAGLFEIQPSNQNE